MTPSSRPLGPPLRPRSNLLADQVGPDTRVDSITDQQIDGPLDRWQNKATTPYNRHRAALLSFFGWCTDSRKWIVGNPVTLVEPRKVRAAAFRLCRETLHAHLIRVVCGGRDPDGADGALLRQARRLRKRGVGRFMVASNDRAFARVAGSAEVRVVTLTGDLVSGRLRAAASSVTGLLRDGEGCPRRPTP